MQIQQRHVLHSQSTIKRSKGMALKLKVLTCAEEERNSEAARRGGVDRKCSESYMCHPLS